ncbi:MAG: MATE family efflux transporter [Eubacteriales bacterium]|nr:MATE family efflux transporter [Eubacteriales bacterium]
MNKDLTVGDPEKVLWRFCIPLFGSVIFQQLYNIADSLVAGKLIGENALAAVGNSYEITLIFIALAFGCNMGCSVIVSRFFGAKDYQSMKRAVSTAMISSAVLVAVMMITGLITAGALLRLIQTPEEIMADSALYLRIYIWGLPFMFFYNISTGIFSALGDTKTPFIFLAFSSTANILADILFVSAFQMGVAGVAWATLICQGVSCILAVITVMKRIISIPGNTGGIWFSMQLFKMIITVAVPSMLQQSFISVGNIIIQYVINGFGAGVIAGYAAGVKLNNLVITSFTTLGNGISNFTSQNLGAGRQDRVNAGFRVGIKLVWLISVPVALLYMFGGRLLLMLFLDDPTETALNTGIIFLRILSPFYFFVSAKLISDGILRGSGLMRAFMIGTFSDLIIRVVLAVALSKTALGSTGIWISWPIGWVTSTIISVIFYRRAYSGKKQNI